ncbi:MAG: hypothetical protein HY303_18225, partial [Candidatus Wallbacteria bacterium]|nr:hypothetical protein [Candidatus Wallbacteria bacterium]
MHSFRGPVWGAVATLLIATGIAATVRAGSVLDGPTRRDVTGKPDAQMDTLDYHLIDRADVPKKKKLDGDPSLRKQLEALDLGKSKNDFQKLKENKPEPGLDTSQWIPGWMGTTGGLDLPWAYSLAKGA